MTTLTLNIKDDSKVQDVLRFLSDIDFLEVKEADEKSSVRRSDRFNFQGFDLGWSRNSMTRDEMNAR